MAEQSNNWHIFCLEHDEASERVSAFLQEHWPGKVSTAKIRQMRYPTPELIEETICQITCEVPADKRIFTTYGSGNFHHFTFGLLKVIADVRSRGYTYLHVDQHTDNGVLFDRLLTCANFVSYITELTRAQRLKYAGAYQIFQKIPPEDDLEFSVFGEAQDKGIETCVAQLMQDAPKDVYATIDLDVLKPHQMLTAYPGGVMYLNTLLKIMQCVDKTKNVISADACGFHVIQPNKTPLQRASILVYGMIAGTLFGEDITAFREEHALLTR